MGKQACNWSHFRACFESHNFGEIEEALKACTWDAIAEEVRLVQGFERAE